MLEINGYDIRMTAGDTAAVTFTAADFDVLPGDVAVFTVKTRMGVVMMERYIAAEDGAFTLVLLNPDTEGWRADEYRYDVRIIRGPVMDESGRIVDGQSIMTPFRPSALRIIRAVGIV